LAFARFALLRFKELAMAANKRSGRIIVITIHDEARRESDNEETHRPILSVRAILGRATFGAMPKYFLCSESVAGNLSTPTS
jgi:hypothetical protein